jgi:DNA-binding transcriptional MerR regulator
MPVGTLLCVIDGQTRGRPWTPAAARNDLRRISAKAGVRRRFAPHQLRHAHAVEMAREGVPLKVIQRQLGHVNRDGKLSSKGSRPHATALELGADAQNPPLGASATFGESNLGPSAHLQKVCGSRPSEMPSNERLWERPDGAPCAGPQWVHTDADALAGWRDEKGLQIAGFHEAADGIRTHDLLHGKQNLQRQFRTNIPANRRFLDSEGP